MYDRESELRRSMAILSGDISLLHDQMRRLNELKAILQGKESELESYKERFRQPELHARTWHGKYATEFDTIRISEVYERYGELTSSTFSSYYRNIEIAHNYCENLVETKTEALKNRQNQLEQLKIQQAN